MERSYLQSIGLAIVALVAGLLVGAVGVQVFNINDETVTDTEPTPTTRSAVAQLRTQLNLDLQQHTYGIREVMRAAHERRADLPQTEQALEDNNEAVMATLQSVYEDEATDEFESVWSDYTVTMAEYATVVREQDDEAINISESELESLARSMAEELAELTDQELALANTQEGLDDYVRDTLRAHNAWTAGNWDESYTYFLESQFQIRQLADDIAEAIVISREDDFRE